MHQHSSTGGASLVDAEGLIVACNEPVRALAWKFARNSNGRVDAEDMYSVGMLEICESVAAGRLDRALDPMAYLVGVARLAMCEEYRRVHGWSTVSLDAPLSSSDGDTFSLADLLPAPAPSPQSVASKKERALHGALGRLTRRQRAALRRRYALEGRGATSRQEAGQELGIKGKSVTNLARRGMRSLRSDARLCAVVGVEVQG
jgi:RNA polymerase sigma factor (sigma-70 family)